MLELLSNLPLIFKRLWAPVNVICNGGRSVHIGQDQSALLLLDKTFNDLE
jgi:hypothetical protein